MIHSSKFQKWLIAQGYYRVKGVWHNLGSPVHGKTLAEKLNQFEKRKASIKRKPRTPTDLMDQLTIYCHVKRQEGVSISEIAFNVNKHHSTVSHHLKRYKDLISVDKEFRQAEKSFNEKEFIQKYKSIKTNDQ